MEGIGAKRRSAADAWDETVREARGVAAELLPLRGFGLAVAGCVLVFALGTHVRNRAWQGAGSLWLDIVNKVYRMRIMDPETGIEAPRMERARIYNNIGLYLYDRGRNMMRARAVLTRTVAQYDAETKRQEKTPVRTGVIPGLERRIVDLYDEMAYERELLSRHIPDEFRAECRRAGVGEEERVWDAFLPAELCFRRAHYHNPMYYKAYLNLGLIWKLRGLGLSKDEAEQKERLRRAAENFRIASTIAPLYEMALRYLADVLLRLEEYAEARRAAIRAVENHMESEGENALREEIDQIIAASEKLGDFDSALEWVAAVEKKFPAEREQLESVRCRLQESRDQQRGPSATTGERRASE